MHDARFSLEPIIGDGTLIEMLIVFHCASKCVKTNAAEQGFFLPFVCRKWVNIEYPFNINDTTLMHFDI